jgi:hypothetical protein
MADGDCKTALEGFGKMATREWKYGFWWGIVIANVVWTFLSTWEALRGHR